VRPDFLPWPLVSILHPPENATTPADYLDRTGAFLQAGYRIIALSVDEPQRTEHLRQTLNVSFPIWCEFGATLM
jgi:hypothetical protein